MNIREGLLFGAEQAGFTQQDMATWLEYSFSTVQAWMNGDRATPAPIRQKHIATRLKLLRQVLRAKEGGLPVPPSITQYERKAYIEGIRERAARGIFNAGSAG